MNNQAEELYRLSQESFSNGASWSVEQFQSALNDNHWLFIECDKKIVAFLQYRLVFDEIEIYNLVVAKEKKRQGLASQLLDQLVAKGQDKGVRRIFLEVRQSNQAARQLYQKQGFTLQGKRKSYYQGPTEDAYLLMKEIK